SMKKHVSAKIGFVCGRGNSTDHSSKAVFNRASFDFFASSCQRSRHSLESSFMPVFCISNRAWLGGKNRRPFFTQERYNSGSFLKKSASASFLSKNGWILP